MPVAQSPFAALSWVIIAPLCFLLRVGTQGRLRALVTHALVSGQNGHHPLPLIRASEAAQESVLGPERLTRFPQITQRPGEDTVT